MLDFTLLGFIDGKTFFVILHVLGAVIGMGAAVMTDLMYFTVVKDRIITKAELRFIELGSRMVWLGLFIIVLSGLVIFSSDPEAYLASSKFLAKMTIVGVLIINGLVFHFEHLVTCRANLGVHLPSQKEWRAKSILLYASGAISATSWFFAVVLGSLDAVPYSYGIIMLSYLLVLALALTVTMMARVNFLNDSQKTGSN
jgi:hypothetical protein